MATRLMATSSRGTSRPSQPNVPDVPGVVFGRMRYGRIGRTLRARPVLVDTALALMVCLFALVPLTLSSGPSARMVLLTCVAVAPLCLRRRYPVGALIVCAAASYAQILLWVPSFGTFSSMLIAFYTVAKWSRRRATAGAALIITIWIVWFSGRLPHVRDVDRLGVMLVFLPAAIAAGVLGVNANTRRAYVASIADRAIRAERERDQQALLAAAGERARIAREMHDIVAHNLSVMIALADGASYTLRDLIAAPAEAPATHGATTEVPAGGDERALRAVRAVESVSATGREALAQMRSLLGVLRDDHAPAGPPTIDLGAAANHPPAPHDAARAAVRRETFEARETPETFDDGHDDGGAQDIDYTGGPSDLGGEVATAPQPRVADLERLVNQVRHAGRTVGLLVSGDRRELPADAELTIFRIVQESLTNVLKHAGPHARALVRLNFDPNGVDIEVTDTSPATAAGAAEPGAEAGTGAQERRDRPTTDPPEIRRPYGRGIEGMRERAALHGGHLVAGPVAGPNGGWRVAARINAPAARQPTIAATRPPATDRPDHDDAAPSGPSASLNVPPPLRR
ncbi:MULTISPECIES: sensor histidine kinase [Pseudofrankia]|uniref:sensor histidine kinase n=1 Tax=Pseudofrankia TaxID=2994363 RepID=UPI00090FEB46|nr:MULTISPECIES: histidine kinase [Pseudofrankia]OHV32964.1 two-component sensor histidine kinase [Pseudofrankia sp. EUN1h]